MNNRYRKRTFICLGCEQLVTKRRAKGKTCYCSLECYRESERPQRKTGESIICENCKRLSYKPKSLLSHKNHFCSLKCANRYQAKNKLIFICKICGKDFKWSPSRIKDNNPTYCSVKCRNKDQEWVRKACIAGNIIQQNKKGPNKIELAGRTILENLGVEFREQVLIAEKFLVDVFVAKYNLIIQWDGEYWHCHPRFKVPDERQLRRKTLDKSQNAYFKKCGYKVLRFWESDIKKEVGGQGDYIKTTIQQVTG